MKKTRRLIASISLLISLGMTIIISTEAHAETMYKPFILAKTLQSTTLTPIINETKDKLKNAGFEIVGEYSPVENTHIIVISSSSLKNYARQSENGIYGVIQRISITVVDNNIQVSFTNPTYMAHVYRLKTDLADITQMLKNSLGFVKEFGSAEGLSKTDLRDYQYKIFMPDFTDKLELAEYENQEQAIQAVMNSIKNNKGGVSQVYRVDLTDKQETIIGVNLKGNDNSECSSDKYILSKIDFKKIKSRGHLPYEMIIKKGNVYALFAEFRIALSFPDLSMIGSNSFASIMCAPSTIQYALTLAAGGNPDD